MDCRLMIIVNESNLESDPAEIMETSYGLLVNGAWAVCAWQLRRATNLH